MDVSQSFKESRQQKLNDFMAQYSAAKADYDSTITKAVYAQDPTKQQTLIVQVVADNKKMSDALKDFLTNMNSGTDDVNSQTLDGLVQDLVKYQQQYADIQASNDKVATLKAIQATTSSNLTSATSMFYLYLMALIFLCLIITLFAIRSAWSSSIITQAVNAVKGAARRR